MAGGAIMTGGGSIEGGFLTGRKLAYPLFLITLLFFLWGFSYGLLDVLNSHFQAVLDITKLQSTGLQVMYFGGGYFFFSPIAAEVLKRRGYKTTILMGLTFYSLGAIFFWPTAHYTTADNKTAAYGGFLVCTLVIACGLATLETSANSYAVIIGDPASASIRLQFCQAFNGVASFVGPLIASKYFFTGENANNLTNVQYVYLAVACLGVAVAVLYIFTKLPEVSEATLAQNAAELVLVDEEGNVIPQAPFWKQYNMFFAFVAQFCYVGAQVTIGAFFINYVTENGGFDKPTASNFLSYALIIFTVGRFFAVGIAFIFAPSFIILIYSALCIALTFAASGLTGSGGVGCLMAVYWLMAPLYPTLFTMGTLGLGVHTRRGAGVLVMGVAGGAVFPPIQGAVADGASTKISMVIPAIGFIFVFAYALYFWVTRGNMALMRVADVVVATDNAGRRGSTLGGAVGGAINYVHYAAEKESVNDSGMRKASVVSHGRKQSVAFSIKGADGAHVVAAEQKGHPILL